MRIATLSMRVGAALLLSSAAQALTVPAGCKAVDGAAAMPDGHAARVVHLKTRIELIYVGAGSFFMGEAAGVHKVTFARPFYMSRTEVTNAQYTTFTSQAEYDGTADVDPVYDLYLRHLRGKSAMPKDGECPVVWVSWNNAAAFCKWAGLQLPTEAQWEYVCRAGTRSNYYFGDDEKQVREHGWYTANSGGRPHGVAQKPPNAWGFRDMIGNVWEWVADDYIHTTGAFDETLNFRGAPADGSAWIRGCMSRVLKGGSWSDRAHLNTCGSGARFNVAPTNAANNIGFRVVLPLE